MTKQIKAVYEDGVLRPVQPIELPEGERLDLILITRDATQPNNGNSAKSLAEIAALPLEGPSDGFSGREHDRVLYPDRS
jgi:predicted DNA-binding antitoxin AbrB/MazE fold protein